jgi:soluble lytic murein transglycosylase
LYRFLALWLLLCTPISAVSAAADPALERQRDQYRLALAAVAAQDWAGFEPLRGRLEDYPLALYLDYHRLLTGDAPGDRAARFVERSEGSPLRNRFLDRYLRRAGREERWSDFLAALPTPPRDTTLRCYHYRARLAAGDREHAFAGAAELWVHGYSRPEACDPLFDAWLAAGGATAERVWTRMRLAFEARQGSLLRYLAGLAPPALTADAQMLLRLYREPRHLETQLRPADPARGIDALHLTLRRLARYHPELALDEWLSRGAALPEDEASLETARRIAFYGLLERIEAMAGWIDGRLPDWRDDRLTGMRLRWLLFTGDWERLLAVTEALTGDEGDSSRWLYWSAFALRERGDTAAAKARFAAAAQARDYYGFLAAERLDVSYSFNHRPLPPVALPRTLAREPGVRRVAELNHHGEPRDAHAEWLFLLADKDRQGRTGLARLAAAEGWHHLAIDAANEAAASDALELRFPPAYGEVFRQRGQALDLPATELMAIARRESAFFPAARSPAGARGLMQLLPSTGRQVARQLGVAPAASALYEVEDNVLLGSAYYRQLLDRFGGNRVKALAAYNAGPNRVEHWLDSGLPLERWIETLPYRETRNYVKAVLAYRVVFDYLQGAAPALFLAAERSASY